MLSVESGLKTKLTGRYILYAGAYIDYGLNNIAKPYEDGTFVSYSYANVNNIIGKSLLNMSSISSTIIISYGLNIKVGYLKQKSASHSNRKNKN